MFKRVLMNDISVEEKDPDKILSLIIQQKPRTITINFVQNFAELKIDRGMTIITNTLTKPQYSFALKCITAMEIN